MKRILKYKLSPGTTKVSTPGSALPLCVHEQQGDAFVWMLVTIDPTSYTTYTFISFATGEEVDGNGTYIGTVFLNDASLVFHILQLP